MGTSHGKLLQYGVVERGARGGEENRFSADFIASRQVSDSKQQARLSFLHAAPAINRLLVLCDSALHILNMGDLSSLPMAGTNKLRGLASVCVNSSPDNEDPFSVEICVSKTKGCQLALLTLTEDKLSVTKTRDTGRPVQSMAMSGHMVCCALPHTYIVYHLDTGTSTELFPRDGNMLVSELN